MKRKVYIETSVISYLTARPSKNVIEAGHQQSTYSSASSVESVGEFWLWKLAKYVI